MGWGGQVSDQISINYSNINNLSKVVLKKLINFCSICFLNIIISKPRPYLGFVEKFITTIRWTKPGMHLMIDPIQVKKIYRNASRVVHPDKVGIIYFRSLKVTTLGSNFIF